ncbi:AraC family transcriptional regulator [Streptomyces sp. NPDC014894]|uniref:AraC family transcriptional regulator n=1 Tax=Streptomyces sp. NPDC014894 TaxID=3364931 RepID=UPI0036F5E623
MSLIRGTSLQGFPELVGALGADPGPLLDAAGVAREAVGDPGAFIRYRSLVTAVESAARATGAADFGLRLALRQGIEILGPVGVAALTAPSAAEAFRAVDQYLAVYSPAIKGSITPCPGSRYARYEFRIELKRLPPHQQVTELSLGASLRMFRLILGAGFTPVSVHLPHDALAPAADYTAYFGCPVRFAEPFGGFRLRRSELRVPLTPRGAVHDVVREYLSSIAPPTGATVTEAAGALARRLLPTGGLTLELVAGQLSVHPRTLQRHLALANTTFEAVVDALRREEAERCLRDTDMPLSQLSGLLGYSEQSVLTRACHRWFGVAPSAHRRALRRSRIGEQIGDPTESHPQTM